MYPRKIALALAIMAVTAAPAYAQTPVPLPKNDVTVSIGWFGARYPGLASYNRWHQSLLSGSGAGHSATETVWWNISGGGYLRSLQYGVGYVIGTDGMDLHTDPTEWDWNDSGEGTEPADHVEGEGYAATLEPRSLYEDQLARRLAR